MYEQNLIQHSLIIHLEMQRYNQIVAAANEHGAVTAFAVENQR